MGKSCKVVILCLVAFFCLVGVQVQAATLNSLYVEQTQASLPNFITYFYVLDETDETNTSIQQDQIQVFLGETELEVVSLTTQAESGTGVDYYYLIDVSTSIPATIFAQVQQGIIEHINTKAAEDRIVVLLFGESVEVLLDGSDTVEDSIAAIESIVLDERGTVLYDAISKVADIVQTADDWETRSMIFLFSDGVDYQVGGYQYEEVLAKLETVNLPLYSFGYENGDATALANIGELARTSTGFATVITADNAAQEIADAVQQIADSYQLEYKLDTNFLQTDTTAITLKISGVDLVATSEVNFNAWVADESLPEIKSAEVISENTIEVLFSESVANAADKENYQLVYDGDFLVEISSVLYDENTLTATIVTNDILYEGEYVLTASNIVDVSVEKNGLLEKEVSFVTELVPKGMEYIFDRMLYIPISIFVSLLVVILIVILCLVSLTKKKKAVEEEILEYHSGGVSRPVVLEEANGLKADIIVVFPNNERRKVVIGSCYFIGRNPKMCHFTIQNNAISRQHCVLSYDNGILTIQDLNSAAGTMLNGLRVTGASRVYSGDTILLANTKLVLEF